MSTTSGCRDSFATGTASTGYSAVAGGGITEYGTDVGAIFDE